MKLSVIIPCKNEVGVVDGLLRSLALQTRPADEIIVVDSHSTDGTAKHVLKVANELPLQVIAASEKGVAPARNQGGAAASGDVLLFIDADTTLRPDFIEIFLAQKKQRTLQAGGFTQRMASKNAGIQIGARFMNLYARAMQHTPWPIAFSAIFSDKAIFQVIEGFDPELFIMEDYDFVYRAKKSGHKVGIITVPFNASDRRLVGPNRTSIWHGIYGEVYRYTHGLRVTKPIYDYQMGGQEKRTAHGSAKQSDDDRGAS